MVICIPKSHNYTCLAGSSHDLSWIGWQMTGNGDAPMEECIKMLHSPVYRRAIGSTIAPTYIATRSIKL